MIQTQIFSVDQIEEAVKLLKKGELLAVPTETVYGLAADAKNEMAMKKIFIAKGRPVDHPLILHLDSLDKIYDWAQEISAAAERLAQYFWPGPLTMVLKKRHNVSQIITGGLDTLALRISSHPVMQQVIAQLGNPIVAPSANAYQKTSPTEAGHVLKTLQGKIAGIIEGGQCHIGIESTIIDMTQEMPTILRPGMIATDMIEEVLQQAIQAPIQHSVKVSGNMQYHYQTEKPLFLMPRAEIEKQSKDKAHLAIVYYSALVKSSKINYYQMPCDPAEYAKALYRTLHFIDKTDVKQIWIESPPFSNAWWAIYDRLSKAAVKT